MHQVRPVREHDYEAFYRAVCGFDQVERISGVGFVEAIMRPSNSTLA